MVSCFAERNVHLKSMLSSTKIFIGQQLLNSFCSESKNINVFRQRRTVEHMYWATLILVYCNFQIIIRKQIVFY